MIITTRKFKEESSFEIRSRYCTPIGRQKDQLDAAFRTYATWLVRATRRKMAASEPENTPPKKEVELT